MRDKNLCEIGIPSREVIYNFLVDFFCENGYAPSVREIASGTNLQSTSDVYRHLNVLEEMGKIRIVRGQPRCIQIIGYKFVKNEMELPQQSH